MRAIQRLAVFAIVEILLISPVFAFPLGAPAGPTVQAPTAPLRSVARVLETLGSLLAVGMAIKVKDIGAVTQKYQTRAAAAAGDYKTGVQQAGADWQSGALAGESNFEQGVQQAIAAKRYGRGIQSAGADKYVQNAVNLGAARYPQGVQQAAPAFSKGMAPVLQRIANLTLPPKGPKRSPQNQQRAAMVALELGKMKDGQ